MNIERYLEINKENLNILNRYSKKYNKLFNILEIYNDEENNIEDFIEDNINIYNLGDKCINNIKNISNNIDDYKIVKKECNKLKKNFKKIVNKLDNKENFGILDDIPNKILGPIKEIPDKIISPINNNIINPLKREVKEKIIDPIKKVIDNILENIEQLLIQIKNLANNIGDKLKEIFKKIFETVLYIFNLINEKVIPFFKKIINYLKDLFKQLPGLIRFLADKSLVLAKTLFRAFTKFTKSPIFPIVLFILIFFGIQIYFSFVTGLFIPFPPPISALFSLYIVCHTLIYRYEFIEKYNNIIMDGIKMLFKNNNIKKILNIKDKEKNNSKISKEDVVEIINVLIREAPTVIGVILLIILVIKIIIMIKLKK